MHIIFHCVMRLTQRLNGFKGHTKDTAQNKEIPNKNNLPTVLYLTYQDE